MNPRRFFVYVVESPSSLDLYHGRMERDLIAYAARLDGIPCATRVAADREAFQASFLVGLLDEMKSHQELLPIVHISAHGDSEGIQLTNGQIVKWQEIKQLLLPFNKVLNGNLLLCLSACEGLSAIQMAMAEGDLPFFALISHSGKPNWSDTAVAYQTLYHLLAKGKPVDQILKAMCAASGDDGFLPITGKYAQEIYLDKVQSLKSERVQEKLEQELNKMPPPENAKMFEAKPT